MAIRQQRHQAAAVLRAYAYNGHVGLLDPQQPVYGLEAPGCDNERTPMTSLPAYDTEYIDALRANYLLGWSMGGVVAFEMARRGSVCGVHSGRRAPTHSAVNTGLAAGQPNGSPSA